MPGSKQNVWSVLKMVYSPRKAADVLAFGREVKGEKEPNRVSSTDIPSWTLDVANSIMEAVRLRDEETYSHCIRVSRGCRLLAKSMSLNQEEQRIAEFAGLFHDIGKIGVPTEILLKPTKLTPHEFEVMKSHPELSVQILQPLSHIEFFARLIPGVLYHHERYDGDGYPEGVMGDQIPLIARLVLVVDTFDAITADRAYRKGRDKEVAYSELRDFSGRQFDPRIVSEFLAAQPTWGKEETKLFAEMNHTVLKRAA